MVRIIPARVPWIEILNLNFWRSLGTHEREKGGLFINDGRKDRWKIFIFWKISMVRTEEGKFTTG